MLYARAVVDMSEDVVGECGLQRIGGRCKQLVLLLRIVVEVIAVGSNKVCEDGTGQQYALVLQALDEQG